MLQIFDVNHGAAALHTDSSGLRTLFDCGHSSVSGFRPSALVRSTALLPSVGRLYVSHADEDHVSDLPELVRVASVTAFYRNRSIPTDALRALKLQEGPLRPGVSKYLALDAEYTTPFGPLLSEPAPSDLRVTCFHNDYPRFTDTNNLSLVCFASFGGVRAIFPGDLEVAGWMALMSNPSFKWYLSQVNLFVASHHGRESGYCREVFEVCEPQIIIVSDAEVQYASQGTSYSRHATGVPWTGGGVRRVLSTRRDGHITVRASQDGGWQIQTER